ncbi:glycosyltransferase family 4 protein [Microbacterium caowuchunii]|uniref:D-inositol 3-phosphate glycosyltransferase n=1 Tax=Microbacterium caowuchunii TaxID=2614638 RepID=A0A5N0TJR1_9MICO|nr:glycosyltransferase family 4 protein [Microbacterium caowuchunii]
MAPSPQPHRLGHRNPAFGGGIGLQSQHDPRVEGRAGGGSADVQTPSGTVKKLVQTPHATQRLAATVPVTPHSTPALPDGPVDPPRPLTILIGADTFAPDVNGAARFAERLAAGLVERGHEVHILAPAPDHRHVGTFVEEIEGAPMTVHRARSWRWYPHDWLRFVVPWRSRHYARRALDTVQPDVVHFQSHIVIGRGLSIEAEKRGIRIVATNHTMPENIVDFTKMPHWFNKILIRTQWKAAERAFDRAEAVTTPTRKAAEFLESNTHIRPVLPVSCGIDASHYTADLTPRTTKRIIFVGRITFEKHLHVLLQAVAKLDPSEYDGVDIVGGGDRVNDLKAQVAKLGLEDRVVFHGRVDEGELRTLYTQAAVFAMPSIAELQSIATMEAMASGLPVVAANAMALPHLVHDGENGWLFDPESADDLAEKLRRVLSASPEEYSAMQQASLKGVEIHDIARTLSTFEALYRGETVGK